jgi:type II secretory pathway predicted ATPase ExeA
MYEEHYGLTADPFRLTPDASLCFLHPGFQKAKASMSYALHRQEGFALITGKPGTGKSTLICDLIEHLPETITFIQITSSQLIAEDLLCLICLNFGIFPEEGNSAKLLHSLHRYFLEQQKKGKHTLLIIDEAQNLSESALEELRLLTTLQTTNKPLLQIFLVGQEKLRSTIASASQTQLRQRITASYHMQPLNEIDTKEYILYRLALCNWKKNPEFDNKIFYYIYRFSNGIPRIINLICSRLFLHGWLTKRSFFEIQDLHIIIHELVQEQLLPISKTLAEA